MKKSWGVIGFAFLALIVLSIFSHSVFAYSVTDAFAQEQGYMDAADYDAAMGIGSVSAGAGASSSSGVSAITSSVSNVINSIVDAINPIVSKVLGNANTGEDLLAKFGFFLIMLGILYVVTNKIPMLNEEGWVQWVVVIVLSVLSVRFLTETAWIKAAMLPNAALLIAIISFLPLAIYFYLIEVAGILGINRVMKVIAWVIAAVAFVGLFITRFDELGRAANGGFNPAWIYVISAVVCILIFLLDKTIQKTISKSRNQDIVAYHDNKIRAKLLNERAEWHEDRAKGNIGPQEFNTWKSDFNSRAEQYGLKA